MTQAARVTSFYIKSGIRFSRFATFSPPFRHRFVTVSLPFRYLSVTVHPPQKNLPVSYPFHYRMTTVLHVQMTVSPPFGYRIYRVELVLKR